MPEFEQPNSRYSTPDDLGRLDREHHDLARDIPVPFTKAEFLTAYRTRLPHRKVESVRPSDYCFGHDVRGYEHIGFTKRTVRQSLTLPSEWNHPETS